MVKQTPELTEKYGPLNQDDISSYESFTTSSGIRPIDYVWGNPQENIEKSALLKKYAAADPSLGKKLAEYTGKIWSQTPAHMGTGKDMYGMAQDRYISEMQALKRADDSPDVRQTGLRSTYQKKRNPMVYPLYPGDMRE
jgi:hypothetical protein